MPGSIRVSVLEAFDLPDGVADGKYVSVKVAVGKREFQTKPSKADGGVTTPWNSDFVFPVLNLRDNLVIVLLGSKGEEVAKNELETPSIVEKGFQDEIFLLKGGGRIHLRLSFVLTEEERRRIEVMRAAALKRREQQATKHVQDDLPGHLSEGNGTPSSLSSKTAGASPPFGERDQTRAQGGKGEEMPTEDLNSPQQIFPRSTDAKPPTAMDDDKQAVHGLHGQSPVIDLRAWGSKTVREPVSNEKSSSAVGYANSAPDNQAMASTPSFSSAVAEKITEPSSTGTVREHVSNERSRSTMESANDSLDNQGVASAPFVSSPVEEKISSIPSLNQSSDNEDHGLSSLQDESFSPSFLVQVQDECSASTEKMAPSISSQPETSWSPVAKPTFLVQGQDECSAPMENIEPLDLNQPEISSLPMETESSQFTSLPSVQPNDVDIPSSTLSLTGASEGSSPEASNMSARVESNPKSVKDKIKAFEKSMTQDVSAPHPQGTKLQMHEQGGNSPSRPLNQVGKRDDNVTVGSTSEKARDAAGESQAAVLSHVASKEDEQKEQGKIDAEGNDSSVHALEPNFDSSVHLKPYVDQSNDGGNNIHTRKEEHGDTRSWSILDASKQVAFGAVIVVAGLVIWFTKSNRRKSSFKQRYRMKRKN